LAGSRQSYYKNYQAYFFGPPCNVILVRLKNRFSSIVFVLVRERLLIFILIVENDTAADDGNPRNIDRQVRVVI